MDALELLLNQIREMYERRAGTPFPYDDIVALRQVFEEEFASLSPRDCFNADLNLFFYTIHGWASGGIRKVLPDAGHRSRARAWLSKSFFERFPQYAFLQPYDLSEYPALHQDMETAESLRCMLLRAIHLYEASHTAPD